MANSGIVKQLKEERDRVEQQLSGLNAALTAFVQGVWQDGETDAQTPYAFSEGPS